MKKTLFLLLVAACLGVTSAEAQTAAANTSRNNSKATATISRSNARNFTRQQRQTGSAITFTPQRTDGVIPRTIRAGDPLQMINPAAPAEYGDGRNMVRREPSDPFQRPYGIKLVSISF